MGERLERFAARFGRARAGRKLAEQSVDWTLGKTPNTFHRPARVMIESTEGPRYEPNDFATVASPDEVTEELKRILSE